MANLQIPSWWKAPEELFAIDGHCGLLAAWLVLTAHGKAPSVPELVRGCRHTKRHGVFTVSLAATLAEYGLTVAFHSDPDPEIGGFERQCYARARRLNVLPHPALDLDRLFTKVHQGHLPIVLFNTDSEVAHFSPLIGFANGRLQLPLAHGESMSDVEFMRQWSAPGILRQCVIID